MPQIRHRPSLRHCSLPQQLLAQQPLHQFSSHPKLSNMPWPQGHIRSTCASPPSEPEDTMPALPGPSSLGAEESAFVCTRVAGMVVVVVLELVGELRRQFCPPQSSKPLGSIFSTIIRAPWMHISGPYPPGAGTLKYSAMIFVLAQGPVHASPCALLHTTQWLVPSLSHGTNQLPSNLNTQFRPHALAHHCMVIMCGSNPCAMRLW